jgi:hypothetical protein
MTQPEGISGLLHGIRLLATRTGFILERPESAQLRRPRPGSVMSASRVRREKAALSSGCEPHPATAPAGSNRSSHGGDEMAEAFGVAGHV